MGGSGRGSSRARLIRRLEALPATTTQEFSTEIRMVVERISEPERKLRKLARDAALSPSVRFAALYGWLLRLRREERYTEYEAVVQRYAHEFAHEPYIYTFHAIVAKNKGDTANLRSAIEYSRHAAELMPDVAGVNVFHQRLWVGDHSMIAGGVAGPET